MNRSIAAVLALISVALAWPQAQGPARPDIRLVLLIAVDQFRYDYLTRFRADYQHGFARLLTHGAVFTDANLEHYPSVTAVGHATMLTGATPSVHGIIGNDWYDRGTAAIVTSVSDPAVQSLGAPMKIAASPHRLLVTTVGDELKMAAGQPAGSPDAPRVFGVSLKDRSAILASGRGANAAFWWDTVSGRFVTSTYYTKALPEWVQAFNDRKLADAHVGATWMSLATPSVALRALPKALGPGFYDAVFGSPFGNDLLLAFVTELLQRERLGMRGATDLLTVSFSSNDSVGHAYGPDSPQVRDIAIRTDRTIGQLLDRLDQTVGLSHVVVALTADHAVAPVPETLIERHLPAGRMTTAALFEPVQAALTARFGPGQWLLATAGSSPYLNTALMASSGANPADVRRVAAAAAMAVPHVARVYTREDLVRGDVATDRVGSRVLRGFNAQRSGDLEIILEPYWMRQAQGTTHGTPYNYDTHIPLILMGPGIRTGEYTDHVALNDLAPTLATLTRVEIPGGSSGRVLGEALVPPATVPASSPERTPQVRRQ